MENHTLCVWPGTIVKAEQIQEFNDFFKEEGFRVEYAESVTTLPDKEDGVEVSGTGGRTDVLFWINNEDVSKFAIWRFQFGIRWWEDVFFNNQQHIYSQEVLTKYPNN